MSQCPKCGATVEHDFGVTACAKCAAVLFVDFDGEIQMADPAGESSSEVVASSSEEAMPDVPASASDHYSPPVIESEDLGGSDHLSSDFQLSQDSEEVGLSQDLESTPVEDAENESEYLEEPSSEDLNPGHFTTDVAEAAEPGDEQVGAMAHTVTPATLDFSDVLEFANRAELDNSPLVYTLWIEGIDHREVRRKVETVLAEPRLNFHLKELLPMIRGGVLELRDLNPAKTNFIATRLRGEAVQFRWRQSVFNSDSENIELSETGTDT